MTVGSVPSQLVESSRNVPAALASISIWYAMIVSPRLFGAVHAILTLLVEVMLVATGLI